jgi:ParB family chromosome partitioning protein
MKIKISEITIHEGRRDVDYVKVSELAESIKVVGLINPITVGKDNRLIAGAHRLEACRLLGFDEIECVLLDCDELLAELAEIDENFIRSELDDIAIGKFANRRDEILKELGLRRKVGGDGGNQHKKSNGESDSPLQTTADIARQMGVSERTLQQNKQLARDLVPEAQDAVREKALPKSAALKLSRLKPEKQREIVAQKDKKAIMSGIREKKGRSSAAKPQSPRKTVAKEQEPDEEFIEQYMDWLNDPVNHRMPELKQNEEYVLKLPLPLDYKSMLAIMQDVFLKESEKTRQRVVKEVKELATWIDLLIDD